MRCTHIAVIAVMLLTLTAAVDGQGEQARTVPEAETDALPYTDHYRTCALEDTYNEGATTCYVDSRNGKWRTLEAVEFATLEWVDWFNMRRLLGPIGNVPPAEFEAQYYAQAAVA